MDLLKEMKKKLLSVFGNNTREKIKKLDRPSSRDDTLNTEEKEKLSEYPSLRQSTPENRDISPY